jgi:hypothetical protein
MQVRARADRPPATIPSLRLPAWVRPLVGAAVVLAAAIACARGGGGGSAGGAPDGAGTVLSLEARAEDISVIGDLGDATLAVTGTTQQFEVRLP